MAYNVRTASNVVGNGEELVSQTGAANTDRLSMTAGLVARTYSARTVSDEVFAGLAARTCSARTISDGRTVPRAVGPQRGSDGDNNPKLQRSPNASLTASRTTTS